MKFIEHSFIVNFKVCTSKIYRSSRPEVFYIKGVLNIS